MSIKDITETIYNFKELILAISGFSLAFLGFKPTIKRLFKGKFVTISMTQSDFFAALRENSDYTIEKFEEKQQIVKNQKMEIIDAVELAKTKITQKFEIYKTKNNIEEIEKIRFENALVFVLDEIVK